MSKVAVEQIPGAMSTYVYPAGYDATKLGLGPAMVQTSTWVGPTPVSVVRPFEQSATIPGVFPHVVAWSATLDWVFLADNAAAAITRRIIAYTYNRSTQTWTWLGYITLTFPSNTSTYTIRGLQVLYDTYTTGTAATNGTAVTGASGAAWQTGKVCVGNRIGFGSTDPTQISTWYEVSAVGSETGITLTGSAGSIGAGPYVVENLQVLVLVTNTTNGGLHVVKGLRLENFAPGGTAVPAAVTTELIRAVYWLSDASTLTNTAGAGLAVEPKVSPLVQYCWVLDGTSTMKLFRYNVRGALTLASGKDFTTCTIITGATVAVSGTASQADNLILATASHGPGNGQSCFYFTTTTRIYRSVPVSGISPATIYWLADVSPEVPPGSVNTMAASSLCNGIEYIPGCDKFVVTVAPTNTPFRSYVTQYRTDGGQWDRVFLCDNRQIDQSSVDGTTTPFPSILSRAFSAGVSNGLVYIAGIGATAATNLVYVLPLGADWEYAALSNCRVVFPAMATPNCLKYYRLYMVRDGVIGGATGTNLGVGPEPSRAYWRTSGIADNSGAWTGPMPDGFDLSSVIGAAQIQFMVEFRTIGLSCIPARILAIACVYEDSATVSNFQPSVAQSSVGGKIFAWRFATAFGGAVPKMYLRLYDAVSGALLLTDDTVSAASGAWTKCTDGSTYGAYNTTDLTALNTTTYIRYTPTSIVDNAKVRAVLSLT